MALLRTARSVLRTPGVHAGRDIALGRHVRLEVGAGAQLVIGDGCRLGDRTRIVVQRGRVELGAGARLDERCTIVAHAEVRVGAGAWLQDGAVLVDFDHGIDDVELPIRARSPMTIGADAVVGPHAVVTRDVAAGATVGGVPARPLADLG